MIIKSFQRRYVPNNVTGIIDRKTFKISHYLSSKENIFTKNNNILLNMFLSETIQ